MQTSKSTCHATEMYSTRRVRVELSFPYFSELVFHSCWRCYRLQSWWLWFWRCTFLYLSSVPQPCIADKSSRGSHEYIVMKTKMTQASHVDFIYLIAPQGRCFILGINLSVHLSSGEIGAFSATQEFICGFRRCLVEPLEEGICRLGPWGEIWFSKSIRCLTSLLRILIAG